MVGLGIVSTVAVMFVGGGVTCRSVVATTFSAFLVLTSRLWTVQLAPLPCSCPRLRTIELLGTIVLIFRYRVWVPF